MSHHRSIPSVALGPSPLSPLELEALLHLQLSRLAKQLRRSVPGLPRPDCQFLADLAREEIRFPMKSLIRLARIAARSPLEHHRYGLMDAVRTLIDSSGPTGTCDVVTAFDNETDAQGAFDKAQLRYNREPSRDHWLIAVDAGVRQLAWTQASIDALKAAPPVQ